MVCVCADSGSSVSPQTAQCVFKGSSGQSCHTQWDNNRMCYVYNANSFLPTLRGLVSLGLSLLYMCIFNYRLFYFYLYYKKQQQQQKPLRTFFKNSQEKKELRKTENKNNAPPLTWLPGIWTFLVYLQL